jgi:hypothetical protein
MKETIAEFVSLACIIAVSIAATNAMKFIFAYIIALV